LWSVINKTWQKEQEKEIVRVKEEGPVDLCGDGRCDSPGHNAKFGTYTLMQESTGKIVNFQVVQVNETTSSNAMEAEGCKRGLNYILSKDMSIRCLSTDRHITVTSYM
jgi:solute carrier family 8 (sodium/calcium exchanger)